MVELLYIIGKSSSGKDTIKNGLVDALKVSGAKVKELVLYTTREIRAGEINGLDYNFVTEDIYQELIKCDKVIETRTYNKVQGMVRYFTVIEEELHRVSADYIVGVGTLVSYNNLVKYFKLHSDKQLSVTPIYLEVENCNRLLRAMKRELKEEKDKQNFEEVCRRFEADELDYSEKNIVESAITKRFQNKNIDGTIVEIFNYLNIEELKIEGKIK